MINYSDIGYSGLHKPILPGWSNFRYGVLKFITLFAVTLLTLLLTSSCTQNDICLEPQAISLHGGFYHKDTTNNIDTSLGNANFIFGSNAAYLLNMKNTSKFSFPLSQVTDTIPVIFQADSTNLSPDQVDTFQLIYSRELHFISVACGYQTYYTLKNVSTSNHVIDSVLISTAEITNDINKEHIQIVIKN